MRDEVQCIASREGREEREGLDVGQRACARSDPTGDATPPSRRLTEESDVVRGVTFRRHDELRCFGRLNICVSSCPFVVQLHGSGLELRVRNPTTDHQHGAENPSPSGTVTFQ